MTEQPGEFWSRPVAGQAKGKKLIVITSADSQDHGQWHLEKVRIGRITRCGTSVCKTELNNRHITTEQE
jgi:hypothetical protein